MSFFGDKKARVNHPDNDQRQKEELATKSTAASPLLDEHKAGQSNDETQQDVKYKKRHQQQQQEQLHQGQQEQGPPLNRVGKPAVSSHYLEHNSRPARQDDIENRDSCGQPEPRAGALIARPKRTIIMARPVPFEPITDPFAWVCQIARRPKFGHQYVLCPGRSSVSRRRTGGNTIGLSVGPHWSGVIYTTSIIAVITLFLTRFIMNDLASWYKPATVACSCLTVAFLLATAVVDPGIVVQSGEAEAGGPFCDVCSIWRPDDAEHCEEW